jgi:hypothetical protein
MKQKGFALIVILAVLGLAGYYFYKNYYQIKPQQSCTLEAKICPDGTSVGRTEQNCEFAACPTSQPNSTPTVIEKGTVSGKLCYPSSFLPPGEIVAKNLDTGEKYTQGYKGTFDGGGQTYTLDLPVGIYHLRFQAHASTKDTSIFTSGYYDECAKTMHTDQCTPDNGHINIDVEVEPGKEIQNVDLCDFYYNPTQMAGLEKDF